MNEREDFETELLAQRVADRVASAAPDPGNETIEEWWEFMSPGPQRIVVQQAKLSNPDIKRWKADDWERVKDYYVRNEMNDARGFGRYKTDPDVMKKAVAKLAKDAEKDLKKFVTSLDFKGNLHLMVSTESRDARGGYGPYEMATIRIGNLRAEIVGDVPKGTIGVGAYSGNHALESMMGRGAPKDAPALLKRVLDTFKEWISADAQRKKQQESAAPKGKSLDDVAGRLRSMKLGPGGSVRDVERISPKEWSVEPRDRQRLDHYGNDGEGWDEDGWSEEYAAPTRAAAQKWLDSEYGAGTFSVSIGEKGHVDIFLTSKGEQAFK